MDIVNSCLEQNHDQLTFTDDSRTEAEEEFQKAYEMFFNMSEASEAEKERGLNRLIESRTTLINEYDYTLEAICDLVDRLNKKY